MESSKKSYTTSINEWLNGTKPFASSDQLTKKHQEIQESAMNHLNSNLKGPNEFTAPSMIQLQQVQHFTFDIKLI